MKSAKGIPFGTIVLALSITTGVALVALSINDYSSGAEDWWFLGCIGVFQIVLGIASQRTIPNTVQIQLQQDAILILKKSGEASIPLSQIRRIAKFRNVKLQPFAKYEMYKIVLKKPSKNKLEICFRVHRDDRATFLQALEMLWDNYHRNRSSAKSK